MSTINILFTVSLIIAFNFIYLINGGTLCPASDCPDKSFCAGKDDGNYQNPQDDNNYPQTCFISCVGEQSLYCMSCPANLIYDPASDRCDYPPSATDEEAKAVTRRLLNGEDASNCPDKSFCEGKFYGNYQNPVGHPQTYYISCDMAENLYCMACAANLVYNPTSDKCDYPPSVSNEVKQPASIMTVERTETKDGEESNAINDNNGATQVNNKQIPIIVMAEQFGWDSDDWEEPKPWLCLSWGSCW